jgi:hypothetical protein
VRLCSLLVAVAAVLVLAPAAGADVVDDAGSALQRQAVFVAPETTPLSQADVGRLQRQIAGSGQDIHIAILPDSAGDPVTVLRALNERIGGHGVVGVVVGRHFRAGANRDAGFSVGDLAREAVQSHRGDAPAALTDFVRRVHERADGEGRIGPGGNGGGVSVLPLLLIVVLAVGGIAAFSFARNRSRRHERDAQLSDVKRTANEDLVALGDDIRALDIDTQMPGADSGAKSDYERAVLGYDAANRRLGSARTLRDLQGLGEQLEDARFAMESAKARLAGQPAPERRPPCFFDPRHGPSTTEVGWAPQGGASRTVPVCAACATGIADGRQPNARTVDVDGQSRPWWTAPAPYAGYYGGYFSPFAGVGGGFLGGLLVGEMLGGGFGGYGGWGEPGVVADPGWDQTGGDFDGGDFGGGDFGGGDFGGGDFGRGDFGGGDFGGGDF